MKTFIFTLLFILFSISAYADERISDEDDKILAQRCADIDELKMDSQFSYWPAEIIEIWPSGATIKQFVRRKEFRKRGGNSGWGEAKNYTIYRYLECVWHNVPKGEYNKYPSYTLFHWGEGELPVVYTLVQAICRKGECGGEKEGRFMMAFFGKRKKSFSGMSYQYRSFLTAKEAYDNRLPSGHRIYDVEGHK